MHVQGHGITTSVAHILPSKIGTVFNERLKLMITFYMMEGITVTNHGILGNH